ncbi:MAG: GTP 3',8-cyclase MoaA [Bradymonadia bacterium]
MRMINTPSMEAIQSRLIDPMQRTVGYLRVSVTDRCNFRCSYCHPTEDWSPTERENILSMEEITRFVGWMVEQGVRKVRLTGGEPLIRKGIVSLVHSLKRISGLEEVVMTTNGVMLERLAQPLRDAGLDRLNVSLDTLDETNFERVTRGGHLATVLDGLRAADAAGFTGTKLNAVLLDEVSSEERKAFVEFCWSRGYTPRFIELMPIGNLDYQHASHSLSTIEVLGEFERQYDLVEDERPHGTVGPAKYWVVSSGPHRGNRLGTISPMSDGHFCGTCNRVRLTAAGALRGCLGSDNEVQLLQDIRNDRRDECLSHVRKALNMKAASHLMTQPGFVPLSAMTGIGG